MVTHPGEVALSFADSLLTGDFDRLVALHHPDLICSLLGDTLVSGRFRGRDPFFAHTFKHVLGKLAPSDEIYLKGHRLVAADEERAALLLRGGLPTRAGGRYDQNYLQIFRVVDGKIRETHELLDTVMVDTQLYGRQLVTPRAAPVLALRPELLRPVFTEPPGRVAVQALATALTDALACSDWTACLASLDDGLVTQVAGTTPISGTRRGSAWFGAAFANYYATRLRPDSLRIQPRPKNRTVGEAGFTLLMEVTAERQDGHGYSQFVGLAATCHGPRISELHIYFDTAREEAAVFDNPLTGPSERSPGEPFDINDHAGTTPDNMQQAGALL